MKPPRNRLIRFLDWFFSEERHESDPRFNWTTLPKWPVWLCGLVDRHERALHWGDYTADVSGTRCRCGQREIETDLCDGI